MNRPANFSDADWAEYLQCQAEHADLMDQFTDREAQMEQGLLDTYDEYDFDFSSPLSAQHPHPARQLPLVRPGSASRGSVRGR
ncbi:hypothetical protein ACIP4W_11690 [Streptomyces sp. NPDC088846]|uniref:hypothetical protein n=1 Tax=Streptomyces sp. NPDC088846 TaxID=3365908 RepID=UPI00382E9FE3